MDKHLDIVGTNGTPLPYLHYWNGHGRDEFPVIAAPHLRLRPYTLADVAPLMSMVATGRGAESALDLPGPLGERQVRRWIESHPHHWQHGSALHWAICDLRDDRPAGHLSLQQIDAANGQARLSVWIGARLVRRELAIEAAQAALAFAFTSLDLHRVYAQQLASDSACGRLLFRLGMKRVAGQHQDMLLWELRRGDWLAALTGKAPAARD